MTTPLALSVQHVSKRYRLYQRHQDRVLELLSRRPAHRPFWALRDVSFDVQRGEIVGIVGRNGAGKTTLLRLITGISAPTEGEIDINYRMSAILDLGSGFHPDFTGRENVFLGGAVLGMDEDEIRRKYEGIVAFSELGSYMDIPFRTYSLGMQARLSFSVAISVEPEILIIDEALAAGDAYFVGKCFERIRRICESGATVLFVSHNSYLVQRLCRRALWIHDGRLAGDGEPAIICRDYEAALRQHDAEQLNGKNFTALERFADLPPAEDAAAHDSEAANARGAPAATSVFLGAHSGTGNVWGTGEVRLTSVQVTGPDDEPASVVFSGEPVTIRLGYEGNAAYSDLAVVVLVTRADGVASCTLDAREAGLTIPPLRGRGTFEITLDPLLLGRGRYFLAPHIYRDRYGFASQADVLTFHDRAYELQVERRGRPYDVAVEQPARWRHVPG
ncbi:MAG: ABC transporter ATP-binding protein [Chloroflexota bacterium]